MKNIQSLSDKELYAICKEFGLATLAARRKFEGLLPEVNRRDLVARINGGSWLQKRRYFDVYVFAARLAGMSRPRVDEVLRLEKRFVDKPVLHEALVRGEVSLNKLARIVSIATVENQTELLGKVQTLSKVGLDCFVKDHKRGNRNMDGLNKPQDGRIMNGLQMPQNGQTSLYGQSENADIGLKEAIVKTGLEHGENPVDTGVENPGYALPKKLPVNLDSDIAKELSEMMEKGIDVNELLREFLRDRKEDHELEKADVAGKQMQERDNRAIIGFPAKRYVPVDVRRVVLAEFGSRCSKPGCGKPSINLHHEKGFAKDQCHDPRFLKPLCKGHHELEHAKRAGLIKCHNLIQNYGIYVFLSQ